MIQRFFNWVRQSFHAQPSKMSNELYERFETALRQTDVRVTVYDEYNKGDVILECGTDLHPVTPQNIIQFCRLNRQQRKHLYANKHSH